MYKYQTFSIHFLFILIFALQPKDAIGLGQCVAPQSSTQLPVSEVTANLTDEGVIVFRDIPEAEWPKDLRKPTDDEMKVISDKIAAEIKMREPKAAELPSKTMKRMVQESLIEAIVSKGMKSFAAPLFLNVTSISMPIRAAVNIQLGDFTFHKDFNELAVGAALSMGCSSIMKGKILPVPPSSAARKLTIPETMDVLASPIVCNFAAGMAADILTAGICGYFGVDSTILYVPAKLVTQTACLTASKYILEKEPALGKAISSKVNEVYQHPSTQAMFKKVCSKGKDYTVNIFKFSFGKVYDLTNMVKQNIGWIGGGDPFILVGDIEEYTGNRDIGDIW